jgi:pyrimidine-nucleoside phosphorylase
MTDLAGGRALAGEMIAIGEAAGRRVTAFVTDMDRPLGRCVGNALEVREAIEVLGGAAADARLTDLATTVTAEMLRLGGMATSDTEARAIAADGLRSGCGLPKLREIVEAQGGDPAPVDDPSLLPTAPVVMDVVAESDGFVTDVEPMAIALTANRLGAGRVRKGDPIDHAVGLEILRTSGDAIQTGHALARIHASTDAQAAEAVPAIRAAFVIGAVAPDARSIVLDRVSTRESVD